MIVRTFDLACDLDQVIGLWSHSGPGIQLSASDREEELRKKLARDPDLFLVAEHDGDLVAAVLGGFDGRRGIVYHLAVEAGHRRRGIGQALMEELERRLQGKGCLKYYLLVRPDNAPARAFYQTLGWERMDLDIMGKQIT